MYYIRFHTFLLQATIDNNLEFQLYVFWWIHE